MEDDVDFDDVINRSMKRMSITRPDPLLDLKTQKRLYNQYVTEAKQIESKKEPDWKQCLVLYEKAFALFQTDTKLSKKIESIRAKLDRYVKQPENNFTYDAVEKVYFLKSKDEQVVFKLPRFVYDKLYNYQRESMEWFWNKHCQVEEDGETGGGILGDDMGLGKSFQTISFLYGLFFTKQIDKVLMLMPVSVLQNWVKEFDKWCSKGPRAPTVHVFHGLNTEKQRNKMISAVKEKGGVLLTSYGTLVSQIELFSAEDLSFDYIILDEGHKIKNDTIKLSQSLRQVKADYCRYILTGTPVQNSLEELWSLYDWIFEGRLLGSKRTFKSQFESKIVRASEKDASVYEIKLGSEISRKLRELIAPHFLRREKSVVLKDNTKVSITTKNDLVVWIRNTDHQLDIYSEFLAGDMVKQVLKKSECVLAAITYLKQICSHPNLLKTEGKCTSVSNMIEKSGKMKVLDMLLKQLFQVERDEKHKLLLFSQSTKMLDMIEILLNSHKIRFLRIDGTISDSRERQKLIDTFNDPEQSQYRVFLLTSQVGGVGITLTAADRVIIFDSSWNPAIDNQAVDRAYRIGQKRDVVIYRFITCGTIEEKVYRKQIFKGALSKQATEKKASQFRYFTHNELRDLFKLDNEGQSSTTQTQLASIHKKQCHYSEKLSNHINKVQSQSDDIVGLSDHDLLFTKDDVIHEELALAMEASQAAEQSLSLLVASKTPSQPSTAKRNGRKAKTIPDDDEDDDFAFLDEMPTPKKRMSVARKLSLGLGLITEDDSDVDSGDDEDGENLITDDEDSDLEGGEISDTSGDEGFIEQPRVTRSVAKEIVVIDSSSEDDPSDDEMDENSLDFDEEDGKDDENEEQEESPEEDDGEDSAYMNELIKARKLELSGNLIAAIDSYMTALSIHDDDDKLHCKIVYLGKKLGFCT